MLGTTYSSLSMVSTFLRLRPAAFGQRFAGLGREKVAGGGYNGIEQLAKRLVDLARIKVDAAQPAGANPVAQPTGTRPTGAYPPVLYGASGQLQFLSLPAVDAEMQKLNSWAKSASRLKTQS